MRRIIALTTVVAALVGATSATAAPNPQAQGQKLCERQGGGFEGDVSTASYACAKFDNLGNPGPDFTARDVSQAAKLCSRSGGGFVLYFSFYYVCFLP